MECTETWLHIINVEHLNNQKKILIALCYNSVAFLQLAYVALFTIHIKLNIIINIRKIFYGIFWWSNIFATGCPKWDNVNWIIKSTKFTGVLSIDMGVVLQRSELCP